MWAPCARSHLNHALLDLQEQSEKGDQVRAEQSRRAQRAQTGPQDSAALALQLEGGTCYGTYSRAHHDLAALALQLKGGTCRRPSRCMHLLSLGNSARAPWGPSFLNKKATQPFDKAATTRHAVPDFVCAFLPSECALQHTTAASAPRPQDCLRERHKQAHARAWRACCAPASWQGSWPRSCGTR